MNSQYKKGIVELCILKYLSKEPMSAHEIMTNISEEFDISGNTIYPILKRLTNEEYVSNAKRRSDIGAPRNYSYITEKGLNRLDEETKLWDEFVVKVRKVLHDD